MLYTQFLNEINKQFFPVVIIEGDDAFLRDDALDKLRQSLKVELEELNVTIKDGNSTDIKEILALANSFPIMSEKRLIIVKDFLAEKKSILKNDKNFNELVNYSKEPNMMTCLVFLYNSGKCPFVLDVIKVDCNRQPSFIVSGWIRTFFLKNQKSISKLQSDRIATYCNCDMSKVYTAVCKLLSYCESEITDDAITLLVPRDIEVAIFDLSNAICVKDFERALLVCQKILIEEPPIKVLQTLYTAFRRMFFVFVSNLSNDVLAEKLGVSSYSINIAREQCDKFGAKKLREAIKLCSKSNFAITNLYGNDKLILNDLVLSLCNL